MTNVTDQDVLHYGVKGMKWGVINEKRSTFVSKKADAVKSKVTSARAARNETNAKRHDATVKDIDKKLADIDAEMATIKATTGKLTPRQNRQKVVLQSRKQLLIDERRMAFDAAKAEREGKLTDRQKQLLKSAAIATGVLAAYGGYRMLQTGELSRQIQIGRNFLTNRDTSLSPWKLKEGLANKDFTPDEIMQNVVKGINPDFGSLGANMNCRRCTFAYEMRRRGFDVAATKTTNGFGGELMGMINATELSPGDRPYGSGRIGMISGLARDAVPGKDPSKKPFLDSIGKLSNDIDFGMNGGEALKGADPEGAIFRALRRQPNGARGELAVTWAAGGAHSIAWEIVGGKPVIFDAQIGKKFMAREDFSGSYSKMGTAAIKRLDNIDLNNDYLMRWLKDA